MKLAVLFSLLFLCLIARQNAAQASAISVNPDFSSFTTSSKSAKTAADVHSASDAARNSLGFAGIADDDEDEEGFLKKHLDQQRCFLVLSCIFLLHERVPETKAALPAHDTQATPSARYLTQRVLRI